MNNQYERVARAYYGSDPSLTRAVLKELERYGLLGKIAGHLFRAQKASARAKAYRGDYKFRAYDNKAKSLERLGLLLKEQIQIDWGYGDDPDGYMPHVMYVDLPNGQVSFHIDSAHGDKHYAKEWDGTRQSQSRVVEFCQIVRATLDETLQVWGDILYMQDLQEQANPFKVIEALYFEEGERIHRALASAKEARAQAGALAALGLLDEGERLVVDPTKVTFDHLARATGYIRQFEAVERPRALRRQALRKACILRDWVKDQSDPWGWVILGLLDAGQPWEAVARCKYIPVGRKRLRF